MMRTQGIRRVWLGLLLVFFLVPLSQAILFVSTGDPSHNTNAPTGSLTNSGWQYEGQWNFWLGTPIAPTFFLAAQHIQGAIGQVLVLDGFTYHTVNYFDNPNSDLRIWQVAETFPSYAPLYTKSNEVGKTCVIIGRGTDRGPAVIVSGTTNGWTWGNTNNIERWGENVISGIYTDATLGMFLTGTFDRNGITNECDLSYNDSSGGLFIQDGGTWKLAAINYSVDGPFSYNGTTNTQFNGALVDARGLYFLNGTNWDLIGGSQPVPTSLYCTRVSSQIAWINSIINFNLGYDLGISGIQAVGTDTQISLSTGSNRLYRVDYTTNLVDAIWTTLTNDVMGTGGTVTVIDPGAASLPQRSYRATIVPSP